MNGVDNKFKHDINEYITEDEVKNIISRYNKIQNKTFTLDKFSVSNASDKMLGFLSDYWKLTVFVNLDDNETEILHFFVKAVSRTNAAKADLVTNTKFFHKEFNFYVIKNTIEAPNMKPWSPRLVSVLENALVFEDLGELQYKLRNKFTRFDMAHTQEALKTLARFHACSIIYEEKKKIELQRYYTIEEEYEPFLDRGGYKMTDQWFIQCMTGALEAVKNFSKYSKDDVLMKSIENNWGKVWESALTLSDFSYKYRNVICHRDLWNNNILFHYKKEDNSFVPDDCVFVDFQAVRCQPPAGDVMLLLCCNLDPTFRENNLIEILDYYYKELEMILYSQNIGINNVLSKEDFLNSAEEQRKWGLIVCACLMPQFWIDEDQTTTIFCNTKRFEDIMTRNKSCFINNMMKENSNYRVKVMEIFEEIVERYCIPELTDINT